MEGFPELDASIGGMVKGKLVTYVRAVFRHIVPKDHEKVCFFINVFFINVHQVLHWLQNKEKPLQNNFEA